MDTSSIATRVSINVAAFLTPPHINTRGESAKETIQVSPFDTFVLSVDFIPDFSHDPVDPNFTAFVVVAD